MIKLIFHIADIHIRTYKRIDETKQICQRFINEAKKLSKDYKYDEIRIVIAGDLAHQKITISNELMLALSWFLNECSEIGKTVVIAGNHDLLENNKDRLDTITPVIEMIKNPNIIYYKTTGCYKDENIVWCVYSIFEDNSRPDIEGFKLNNGYDYSYIGLYHGAIIGAKTDLGYSFEGGCDLSVFDGLDWTLCGDIHKRQIFYNKEKRPVIQVGSLMQQGFGETISKHGFNLVNLEADTFNFFDIENEYSFYQFRINSINDLEENKEELTNE